MMMMMMMMMMDVLYYGSFRGHPLDHLFKSSLIDFGVIFTNDCYCLMCSLYSIAMFKVARRMQQELREKTNPVACTVYTLTGTTRLPAESVVLTVSKNKAQLIDIIVSDLRLHANEFQTKRLVVTGKDPFPTELYQGQTFQRNDMWTTQEEADTIIIQQVSQVTAGTVLVVVADDTDVFLLLLYYCNRGDITCKVLMTSPIEGRSFLDIKASVETHKQVIPDLLAAHALTGCDTVASPHGIGKMTALKVLRSQIVDLIRWV